jgi:hypothetical protein
MPNQRDMTEVRRPVSAINDCVDEDLAAIDELVRCFQATIATYRDRQLDWGDVASMRQVRKHLNSVVKGFGSAEAAAARSRAARQVATEVLQFRVVNQAAL